MDELFSLFQVADLAAVRPDEWLEVVEKALDGCSEDDPRYPWLVSIEEELLQQRVPLERLEMFAARFRVAAQPEVVTLEAEFEELAQSLPEAEWQTSHYLQLVRALDEYDDERLEQYLQRRYQEVQEARQGYAAVTMTPEEVTAETYVGHQLLTRGLEAWMASLERLLQDPEGDWEAALQEAEWGNRLLVAVQRLHSRISMSMLNNS